jgi:uncharacterized protein
MLAFDLRALASAAAVVDDVLPSDDPVWKAEDRLPVDGVRVTGRLSVAGPGRLYFSGQISGRSRDACRRCLEDVETELTERVQMLFAASGAADEDEDDPDVYLFDPRSYELELGPAVREQWLLAVPVFVQCREDCAGLCPTCGADLNAGPCGCDQPTDGRWDALRQLDAAHGAGRDATGHAHGTP